MTQEIELISTPVVVPPNYLGTCCNNIAELPDNINYGTTRSWDHNSIYGDSATCAATFINPAKDQYNWQTFDSFISSHLDKRIVFVLGATPDYLVSRAAAGSSYKGTKGNMCPDDLEQWANLVKLLVYRAKNLFGKTGIIWQVWNEIDQVASYNDTISLLGPYTKVTAQAIKSIDPTALVIGPPIAGPNPIAIPFMRSYLTASDGAGKTAADWLDGVALHLYNQSATQASANENSIMYSTSYESYRGMLSDIGESALPIYITETGVLSTDARKIKILMQRAIVFASLGAKLCLWYSYDGGTYSYSAYPTEINILNSLLKEGNVIYSCILSYGDLRVNINNVSYKI